MTHARPLPLRTISVAALILVGLGLGMLPPALAAAPQTVLASAPVPADELARGPALSAAGGALRTSKGAAGDTWTARREICADFTFTAVGLTWEQPGDDVVPVSLRWRGADGTWDAVRTGSDPDHSPDPGTEPGARAGTPVVWTGETRCVDLALEVPPGAELHGIRAVFLNTSGTAHEGSLVGSIAAGVHEGLLRLWGLGVAEPAAATAPRPAIISRAGWGADESLRNCGPSYAAALKMAYVHHTASGNTYTKDQADDVVRSIYAYHTNGRGYCDIAYNFLVDRFGRVYEGRYGGVARPVIGGHAMGFNTGSTGVALIGDFTGTEPPSASLRALKRLLAWRLDVAHVNPTGRATMVSAGGSNQKYEEGEKVRLPVISGHRETGYTTCPGDRLFEKLRSIRSAAKRIGLPKIWNPRASGGTLEVGQGDVGYRARLSSSVRWSLQIADSNGTVVRSYSGTGDRIDVAWNGFDGSSGPTADGTYSVTMRAKDGDAKARPAVLRTRLVGGCDQVTTAAQPKVVGTDGDDVLCGRNGQDDVLQGGGGNDLLLGFGGNDRLDGGPGQDTLQGGPGRDTLVAGAGADTLFSGAGNDSLRGGSNSDILSGGAGDDGLDGGLGRDTLTYSRSRAAVRVDLAAGKATGEGTDALTNLEDVVGSPAADTLSGDGSANRLVGGGRSDTLSGRGGPDVLEGSAGADRFYGGPGDDVLHGMAGADTVLYGRASGAVVVDLVEGTAAGEGADTLRAIVNVVGTRHGDTIRGNGGRNRLVGLGGSDTIVARAGADVLVGGPSEDALRGGPGSDTFRAKDGQRDTIEGGGGTDRAFADAVDSVRGVEQRA